MAVVPDPRSDEGDFAGFSGAVAFERLWESLADVLGAGATATLLRRVLKRARARYPELGDVTIVCEGLDYRYAVPETWHAVGSESPAALRAIAQDLCVLLEELTGPVMIRRLASSPALRHYGLLPGDETL